MKTSKRIFLIITITIAVLLFCIYCALCADYTAQQEHAIYKLRQLETLPNDTAKIKVLLGNHPKTFNSYDIYIYDYRNYKTYIFNWNGYEKHLTVMKDFSNIL